MRIGFIGSHSTGKTSVAEMIKKDVFVGKDFIFVPSSARKVAASGLYVNRAADRESQVLTTLARVVDEQRAYEENPDKHILSDRTPLDSLAYTRYQIEKVWPDDPSMPFFWDYNRKFVEQAMSHYDILFYFPVGAFALTRDGLREDDEKYRSDIDDIMLDLMSAMNVNAIDVPDGPVSHRARFVYEKISKVV